MVVKELVEALETLALSRDRRLLVWVVGPCGVGKSYLLDHLYFAGANTWNYDHDIHVMPPNYEPYLLFIETNKDHIEQLMHSIYDDLVTIKLTKPQSVCLANLDKDFRAGEDLETNRNREACLSADFLYSYPNDKELDITDEEVFLKEVLALYASYKVTNCERLIK